MKITQAPREGKMWTHCRWVNMCLVCTPENMCTWITILLLLQSNKSWSSRL